MRTDSPPPRARGPQRLADAVQARDDGAAVGPTRAALDRGVGGGRGERPRCPHRPRLPRPCDARRPVTERRRRLSARSTTAATARGRRFPRPRSSLPRPRRSLPPPRMSHRWCPAGPDARHGRRCGPQLLLVHHPRQWRDGAGAPDGQRRARCRQRAPDGGRQPAVRGRRAASQRVTARGRVRAAPRADDTARRLCSHWRPRCRHPVSLRLPARSGWGSGRSPSTWRRR